MQRYIRLTNLIPELLDMVDDKRIAFSIGVELSYLDDYEQSYLLEAINLEDKTPSLSQAIEFKRLSQAGRLEKNYIFKSMSQNKPNQREKVSFQLDELKKYFPKSYTERDIHKRVLQLVEMDYKKRFKNRGEER